MDIRIEKRDGFTIGGYLIEALATDESYDAKSLGLRSKHEESLRAENSVLYDATWFTSDEKLYYLFGAEQVLFLMLTGYFGKKKIINLTEDLPNEISQNK